MLCICRYVPGLVFILFTFLMVFNFFFPFSLFFFWPVWDLYNLLTFLQSWCWWCSALCFQFHRFLLLALFRVFSSYLLCCLYLASWDKGLAHFSLDTRLEILHNIWWVILLLSFSFKYLEIFIMINFLTLSCLKVQF